MDEAWIRMNDLEAKKMLVKLAKHDRRTQGDTTALLIRKEYASVFSQPSDAKLSEVATATGSNPGNGSFFNAIEPGKAVVLTE